MNNICTTCEYNGTSFCRAENCPGEESCANKSKEEILIGMLKSSDSIYNRDRIIEELR